jgi:hypothetical protein
MAISNRKDVVHRIRVRLVRNNIHKLGGYIAHVSNEAELSIEDVAVAAKNRGGSTGRYNDMVLCVRQFLNEMAYQLYDGYAVNLDWFSVRPVVGGIFKTEREKFDAKKHPVSFRFRSRAPLRRLAREIVIEMEGPADVLGRIDSFTDTESGTVNEIVTPGGFFTLAGRKIKVTGDKAECGVWFVSQAKPFKRYKVSKALIKNVSTKVTAIVPALPAGKYTVEVITQYTVGGKDLKEPRTVKSGFTVKAV